MHRQTHMLTRHVGSLPRSRCCLHAIGAAVQIPPSVSGCQKQQDHICLSPSASSLISGFSQGRRFAERATYKPLSQSTNAAEVEKFADLANEWWDPQGAFRPLHTMNPTRCNFLRQALCPQFNLSPKQAEPFEGLSFLDVGCGGGILAEALARMGASVTGIEPQQDNIKAAVAHARGDALVAARTKYLACTAEELAGSGEQFDAVMGLEVVEHVDQPQQFLKTLASLTKSDGALFISTINRTARGYVLGILGAEYIAGVLPKGTHDWDKFLTPEELYMLTEDTGLRLEQLAGMVMNPLTGNWTLSTSTEVNYIAHFTKASLAVRLREQKAQPAVNSQAADLASA